MSKVVKFTLVAMLFGGSLVAASWASARRHQVADVVLERTRSRHDCPKFDPREAV